MTATRTKTNAPEPVAAEHGWDPYEVWRTRVLQPRLQERAEAADDAAKKTSATTAVKLVRPPR